jgi:3-hydroxypropanoate dehydrogenase
MRVAGTADQLTMIGDVDTQSAMNAFCVVPQPETNKLSDRAKDILFREARTTSFFTDESVSHETLHEIYDLMKFGPTAVNSTPLRIHFVKSADAKAKLLEAVGAGNVAKVTSAPVTAILAYDSEFYRHLGKLVPYRDVKGGFESNPERAEKTAQFNAQLQAGYFIMAARATGLDAGPIGGFDASKVNELFFADGRNRAFLLVNLGHADKSKLFPRQPRLDFDEAAAIL